MILPQIFQEVTKLYNLSDQSFERDFRTVDVTH